MVDAELAERLSMLDAEVVLQGPEWRFVGCECSRSAIKVAGSTGIAQQRSNVRLKVAHGKEHARWFVVVKVGSEVVAPDGVVSKGLLGVVRIHDGDLLVRFLADRTGLVVVQLPQSEMADAAGAIVATGRERHRHIVVVADEAGLLFGRHEDGVEGSAVRVVVNEC